MTKIVIDHIGGSNVLELYFQVVFPPIEINAYITHLLD